MGGTMNVSKRWAAAGVLGLVLTVAACGGGSSSGSSSGKAADAPTNASKSDFCNIIKSNDSNPNDLAGKLKSTGTPSDIDSSARHGFEVFVDHLSSLPDKPQSSDITKMMQGVKGSDQTDIIAFVSYLQKECL
jgi:hypothetical protein